MADIPARAGRILRFLELFGAAVLVGGILSVTAIGQTAFRSPDIVSHDQAGRLMSRVFEGSLLVEAACVGIIAIGAVGAGRIKRCAIIAILGGALVGGHFALASGMREIRLAHGGSVSGLPKDHPDRQAFGKKHGIYVVLSLALLGLSLGVLAVGPDERRLSPAPA